MIYCKELNKEFSSNKELFKELRLNKGLIISEKKSKIYKSIEKGQSTLTIMSDKLQTTVKGMVFNDDYYYFVVNSSNILDSHLDMHCKGNWEKTKKDQQGKVYLVFDHTLKRSEIIAMKEDVELITADIPFSLLKKDYEGDAYCLIYKIRKDKIVNDEARDWLIKGYSFEASVRMQYVNILGCFNSNSPEDAKEKENFDKYYPEIRNKEDFEDIKYFWVVKEAKNVQESSLVMFGSNSATGLVDNSNEPLKDNQNNNKEAVKNTSELINFYNNINL